MAMHSVSEISTFLKNQIKTQEQIEACLWRLDALMTVAAMTKGLYGLPEHTLHSYFLIAGDLVEEATKANQVNLDNLLKQQG